MRIEFMVYGTPIPKARPRVVRLRTGVIHTFTPDRTAEWEQNVRAQALSHRPERPLEGPLALTLTFYLPKPRSAQKRLLPDRRPDLDNLVKAVKDALNGLIWRADAQIVDLVSQKRYGDPPRVEIVITRRECAEYRSHKPTLRELLNRRSLLVDNELLLVDDGLKLLLQGGECMRTPADSLSPPGLRRGANAELPRIESTEAVVRVAVAVALQAAADIRQGARILRRSGNLLPSDRDRERLQDLHLESAVKYFESKNGLWAATRAVLDCDEVDPLPGFQRDLATVRRWLDARRDERATAADVQAD